MKKGTRIVKRLLALFLVVLMSINTLGAVVSDNDGSAFITKAEFDSLKNNFQSQIDQYNTSIDSKIDGTIAGYLAGIKVSTKTMISLPLANYKKVYCMNKPVKPTFDWPGFNLFTSIAFTNILNGMRPSNDYILDYMASLPSSGVYEHAGWWYLGNAYIKINYANSTARKKVKITGVNEATNLGDPVWNGVATDWKPSINVAGFAGQKGNLFAFEVREGKPMQPGFRFSGTSTFSSKRNFSRSTEIYGGRFVYYHAYYGVPNYSDWGGYDEYDNVNCTIENDNDNDAFQHIISWTKDLDEWHCYDKGWTKSMQLDDASTLESKHFFPLLNNVIDGWFDYNKVNACWDEDRISEPGKGLDLRPEASIITSMPIEANNLTIQQATQSDIIPELGYVNKFKSNSILQDDTGIVQFLDGKEYKINAPKLNEGFVLGYAKSGDEIEWEPVFTEINYDDHFTPLTDGTQVCVMISTSPFTDTITTSDGAALITTTNENGNQSDRNKTTNYKTKLKWIMPKDGWIYVKWMPDLSVAIDDVKNHTWNIALDLTQCSTFSRTAEQ